MRCEVWRQYGPPKRRYTTATLHGVTTQTTSIIIKNKLLNHEMKCKHFNCLIVNKVAWLVMN